MPSALNFREPSEEEFNQLRQLFGSGRGESAMRTLMDPSGTRSANRSLPLHIVRQHCNMRASLALVCQIARCANRRLTQLRRREKRRRQQAIIDEVRKEIQTRTVQERTNPFTQEKQGGNERLPDCRTGCVRPEAATAEATRQEKPCPLQPGVRTKNGLEMYQYQCPFCQESVNSTVDVGKGSVWLAAV